MFFFAPLIAMPYYTLVLVYVLAAVLPAVFLMRYVYRQDRIESEPPYLLGQLALLGVAAAVVSVVPEMLAQSLLDRWVGPENPRYVVLLAFLGVGAVEEGAKLFFLYRRTWRDGNFNYRYDAIVYAVFVSLGFAAFENVKYIFNYGLSVAFTRAILAIPGHMSFAVFMGVFYGRAKLPGESAAGLSGGGDAPRHLRRLLHDGHSTGHRVFRDFRAGDVRGGVRADPA